MRQGYATITTRNLATEAAANHGLVHYYFGSMEELFMRVLERFTERILGRQQAMYADPSVPFIEKWRTAMSFIDEDLRAGYPKIWFELQAMAWNRPEFRERLLHIHKQWHVLLTDAMANAEKEYGIDRRRYPPSAVSTLARTFNLGLLLERLNGFEDGHDSMLRMIDLLLQRLAKGP
ncbi:MAG: TetR/AcrR family transcriptional regulator [Vulcanimicrobiaceae bacterium]